MTHSSGPWKHPKRAPLLLTPEDDMRTYAIAEAFHEDIPAAHALDRLTPEDLARGTAGSCWIEDECAKAARQDATARWIKRQSAKDAPAPLADLRSGRLYQGDGPNFPALIPVAIGLALAASLAVWVV